MFMRTAPESDMSGSLQSFSLRPVVDRTASRARILAFLVAFLALAVGLAGPKGQVQAQAGAAKSSGGVVASSPLTATTCGLAWRLVSSPNVGPSESALVAVSAVSSNDVW